MVLAGVARRSNGMQRRHRSTPKRQVGEGLLAGRQRGHCTCGLRQGPVMRAARCLIQKNPEDSDVFQASW